MTPSNQDADLLVLTSNIVTAHVGRNNVPIEALPQLITDVFNTLRNLHNGAATPSARPASPATPAPAFAKTPAIEPPKAMPDTSHGETKRFPGLRAPNNPAIDPARSIQPDFLVCIESGEKFKTLKRHLAAEYKMTPEQYREKWNLPSDYPMVAPNYSAVRSHLAKESRLGGSAPRSPSPPAKLAETVGAEPGGAHLPAAPQKPVSAKTITPKKKPSRR